MVDKGNIMEVKLEELQRIKKILKEINTTPFQDIVWTYEGQKLEVNQELSNDWKFFGLSNSHFPMDYWIDSESLEINIKETKWKHQT